MSKWSQTSKEYLEVRGYEVDYTERRVGPPGMTVAKDLFGLFDMVGLSDTDWSESDQGDHGKPNIIGVQATDLTSLASHLTKMRDNPNLLRWLLCGGRAELHAWGSRRSTARRKDGKRSRAKRLVMHGYRFGLGHATSPEPGHDALTHVMVQPLDQVEYASTILSQR